MVNAGIWDVPKLAVEPDGTRISVPEGTNLLTALRGAGVNIENVCGGKGVCKKCIIEARDARLTEPTRAETESDLPARGLRLACQAMIKGDSVVGIPASSRQTRSRILEWGKLTDVDVSPTVRVQNVELRGPSLEDQRSDVERLLEAVDARSIDEGLLMRLPTRLRDLRWRVKAILRDDEVLDVRAQDDDRTYGLAVDVGTTTVVAYLVDLVKGKVVSTKSDYNGQIVYGEDVITRMNYAIRDYDRLKELQSKIVMTVNELASQATSDVGCSTYDIFEGTFAGNAVMTSFLVGAETTAIATTPYVPAFRSALKLNARSLGLSFNGTANAYTLPLISGYVGGDVVADILVSGMHRRDEISLLIDLGTNGEVVVGSKHGMLASSTAAGPALEGAGLSNGMRGMEGAIESVSMDVRTYEVYYKTIGDAKPRGICGSGVVDAMAWALISGLIDSRGRMLKVQTPRLVDVAGERAFVLAPEEDGGKWVYITQSDVRRFQLAKAAIYTAYLILTRMAHVAIDDISKVYIAGAFGNYIDPGSAMVVGMIPEVPPEKIVPIGNGSGTGATMVLKSRTAREEVERLSRSVEAIDLNTVKDFQREFVDATNFPHRKSELFPKVIKALASKTPLLC